MLIALALSSGLLGSSVFAQDQPIKRTELIRADVAGVSGKETVIYIADVMPGAEGARHTHYGDEFVYILEGSLIVTPDGKPPVTLQKGDAAHLAPADGIHAAKNGSTSEPAKALIVLVVEKGKPLSEAAK
jgi:quercetin dioxygenase-like cupin family protein